MNFEDRRNLGRDAV